MVFGDQLCASVLSDGWHKEGSLDACTCLEATKFGQLNAHGTCSTRIGECRHGESRVHDAKLGTAELVVVTVSILLDLLVRRFNHPEIN